MRDIKILRSISTDIYTLIAVPEVSIAAYF